jgi:formylglycine-generating enzyme required for sulfatase activity
MTPKMARPTNAAPITNTMAPTMIAALAHPDIPCLGGSAVGGDAPTGTASPGAAFGSGDPSGGVWSWVTTRRAYRSGTLHRPSQDITRPLELLLLR